MKIVLQRVRHASVSIDGVQHSAIGHGLLLLLGIAPDDTGTEVDSLVKKVCALRIFDDAAGVMNLSVRDVAGEVLVVSQFTLLANCRKGNRPSYIGAARPEVAIPLYEAFVARLSETLGRPVATGVFGADMQVALLNDGPVTLCMDTKDWI